MMAMICSLPHLTDRLTEAHMTSSQSRDPAQEMRYPSHALLQRLSLRVVDSTPGFPVHLLERALEGVQKCSQPAVHEQY